jgi:hypothetical protein
MADAIQEIDLGGNSMSPWVQWAEARAIRALLGKGEK